MNGATHVLAGFVGGGFAGWCALACDYVVLLVSWLKDELWKCAEAVLEMAGCIRCCFSKRKGVASPG